MAINVKGKYPWSEVCRAYDIIKSYDQEEYAFLDIEAERNGFKRAFEVVAAERDMMESERDRFEASLNEIEAYLTWKGNVGLEFNNIRRIVREALHGSN